MTKQVYASWVYAIAGEQRERLYSTNRGRLGDMVETALGVCKLTDEYGDVLGKYLEDPNSMSNRIEPVSYTSLTLPTNYYV